MNTKRNTYSRTEDSVERTSSSGLVSEAKTLGTDLFKEWQDLLKSTPSTIKEQVVGIKNEGELTDGEEISFTKTEEKRVEVSPNHNRYVYQEVDTAHIEAIRREENLNREQVKDIQEEIKKLIDVSREMEIAFKSVANEASVEKLPQNPGKYHVGFFEWVLVTIRQARSRIESGSAWLNAFSSKKQQKGYWGGAVKKGGFNNVHMSSERSSVNQTG